MKLDRMSLYRLPGKSRTEITAFNRGDQLKPSYRATAQTRSLGIHEPNKCNLSITYETSYMLGKIFCIPST
jgi:hypothetical protein